MSSRDDILGRVRARLNRNESNAAAGRADIDAALAARAQGPRPAFPAEKSALAGRLIEKSLAQSSTVESVATQAAAPVAVARYLAGLNLPARAVVWPSLAGLDWQGAGMAVAARGAQDADLVGITGCFCAVAETGTLMLCGSPESPATVSLLPETHIALVSASRIVAGMEDAWALARAELGSLPRAVNFISGPSRTGDIEQTIVLGAHGPYRVHLVIVADA
jgi:L-lactate dehydrogenase complex protein LldG